METLTAKRVQGIVIEELMDSDFDPIRQDAYAYVTDGIPRLGKDRISGAFLQLLNHVDWDKVESEVRRMKAEIKNETPVETTLNEIENHLAQALDGTKKISMKDVGATFVNDDQNPDNTFNETIHLVKDTETALEAIRALRKKMKNRGQKSLRDKARRRKMDKQKRFERMEYFS